MNRTRQTTKTGAKANVSGKSDSTKKKANKAIIINSGRLLSLQTTKVDQVLGTILSKANLNVTLKINADQCIVTITNDGDGKRVCTIADILRINGFRKFAMDQKKISEASSILDPVLDRFFNAFKLVRTETEMADFLPPQIQSGPIAAMKDANIVISNLLKNDEALGKMSKVNTKGNSRILIDLLRNWISKTLEIYASLYVKICKGQDTKGFLAEEIFVQKIPKWAFDKFSRTDLNKVAGQDIRRLFFPIDIRKGIYFTVREMDNDDFLDEHKWVLKYSQYQINIVKSPEVISDLARSETEISFTNESDPVGTALRSEKVLLTPHWFGMDFNIEPRTKKLHNFCANPDFSTPRQALRTVLEFGLAIQTGDFKIPRMIEDFLNPLTLSIKRIDFVKNVTSKRNFFKVLAENGARTEACIVAQYKLEGENTLKLSRSLVPLLMRVGVESAAVQTFITESALCVPAAGSDGTIRYPAMALNDSTESITVTLQEHDRFDSLIAKIETTPDIKLQGEVITAAALPKGKQLKKTKTQKFSQLTPASSKIVKIIEREKSLQYLAEPVASWLQGFTNDVVQDVAADLVAAQFGTLLNEFESDNEDSSDSGAGSDDEDDD
jgi:hypothetical protein